MQLSAKDIAAEFTEAMTFPEVMLQFDDMLNDGVSNMTDIAQLISRDPGLAATLLRFANSPLYGFSGEVATIERAIALIGMRSIRNLVFAVSIKTNFDHVPENIMTMDDFWRHSLCCALASQHLADVARPRQRDVLFTAGLIHNIGQLAMLSVIPDACVDVLLRSRHAVGGTEFNKLERELIGFDHHEVGAEIASAWHFPAVLQDTIRFHHTPDKAPQHQFESWIVHIGNNIAETVMMKMDWFAKADPVSNRVLAKIGLDEQQLAPMIPQVEAVFHEMRPVFKLAA